MKSIQAFFVRPDLSIKGRLCAIFLFVIAVSGCASALPGAEQAANNLESILKEADAEVAGGRADKAIALLNQAAKDHPTNAAPWLQMAHIWFEKGNYPSSILAANEVLQRDAANQAAKSLLVVAGLRVAADAVNGLRPNGPVSTNTRVEAENLTQSLRSALGEKELVPPADVSAANSAARIKTKARAKPMPATVAKRSNPDTGTTDPFKSLK